MSVQTIIVGIIAGAATALLCASLMSGSMLAVLLFYLASLPILIVAIGWGHLAGLVAALVAAVALAAVFGGTFFIAFLIGIGLPAWWLGYLVLLGRGGADGEIEWYPVGHLILWSAILGALVVIVAIPNFGLGAEEFRANLKGMFEIVLRAQRQIPAGEPLTLPGIANPSRFLDVLVLVMPPTAAVLSSVLNLINLWLAASIVRVAGGLKRPWPSIAAMTFPAYAVPALALAVGGTFIPGLAGTVGTIATAALIIAFAALGLAVMHTLTEGLSGRRPILAGAYLIIGMFGWPLLVLAATGLIETLTGLRARFLARKRRPH